MASNQNLTESTPNLLINQENNDSNKTNEKVAQLCGSFSDSCLLQNIAFRKKSSLGQNNAQLDLPTNEGNENVEKRQKKKKYSQVPFFTGNPFVEIIKGFLYVYKESMVDEQNRMLTILSVPSSMTIRDLVQFLAPVSHSIEYMRIIRDAKPNHYLVLLHFKDHLGADEFYINFNGIRFNYIDPEICNLAYVAKIEMTRDSEEVSLATRQNDNQTCPVCLEKLEDKVNSLLMILCNHSFHSSCLAQWGDTSCPVCRYSQTPELCQDNLCFACSSQESLWLCLICGHIGCGRYVEGHAHKHYLDSHHTYAMHLENNKVWDYSADNYVHRLVQNKSDGKPVELSSEWGEPDEKLDSLKLEYTHLLTRQLEAQRHFYEGQVNNLEKETRQQIDEIKDKTKLAIEETKVLEEKLLKVTKEKTNQEKKINNLATRINKVTSDLKDEREINKCLEENDKAFKINLLVIEKEIKDIEINSEKERKKLQDQIEMLMLKLDSNVQTQESDESPKTVEVEHLIEEEPLNEDVPSTSATVQPKVCTHHRNRRRKR